MSKRLTKAAYFIMILFAMIGFFIGYHSIDLAHNIAIHHNDWNKAKMSGAKGYLDLRDYEDCNLLGCHRYQTFYMVGMTTMMITFIALFSTVLFQGIFHE